MISEILPTCESCGEVEDRQLDSNNVCTSCKYYERVESLCEREY